MRKSKRKSKKDYFIEDFIYATTPSYTKWLVKLMKKHPKAVKVDP